jgi:uncharacterized tellurite resistance protein B-like protein
LGQLAFEFPPHQMNPKPIKILKPMESLEKWLDWRLRERDGCHWLPAGPIGSAFAKNTFMTVVLSRQIADTIESRGYCVEPDARYGIGSYEWLQTVALFKPFDGDSLRPSTAYIGAGNLLRLCILIANADGRIDTFELDIFRRAIESNSLSQTDHKRLIILEQLLAQELSSSSDYAIAKIIKTIPADKRLVTGKLLVEVATINDVITKEQRRILERIFRAFEIPSDALENLIGQIPLRLRYDTIQGEILNRPDRKWTLKDWRRGHPGDLIDDLTLAQKNWNFTDWQALNARWRALHEQFTQQKPSAKLT